MTKTNVEKLYQYWLTGHKLDLNSAQQIFQKSKQYVQALFFLHLATEKLLKAAIVKTTQDHAPYGHNLSFLASKVTLPWKKEDINFLIQLNSFNLECRYPDDQYKIYKKATQKLVKQYAKETIRISEWILEELKK